MPNRMNADHLKHDGLQMSNCTIRGILNRVADSLCAPAEQIKQSIQKCDILNVDETSARYDSKTVWLWAFHDPQTKTNYCLIKNGRGADALKEVMRENHDTVLVCDGRGPYKRCLLVRGFTCPQYSIDEQPDFTRFHSRRHFGTGAIKGQFRSFYTFQLGRRPVNVRQS